MSWHVYMLECGNGSLYTGITTDIERRIKTHQAGKGAKFTRMFGVKSLVFMESCLIRQDAMKREAQIKRWPRQRKLNLVSERQMTNE